MKHFEDLGIEDFLTIMNNFDKCLFSEKIDGVNLQVGFDKDGLFTERKLKGGKKYRRHYDYPQGESFNAFSNSHYIFEYCMVNFKSSFYNFKQGDLIDLEILYGEQPNVIQYDSGINRIIFLRQLEGKRTYDERIINFNHIIELPTTKLFSKPEKIKFELVPPVSYDEMLEIRQSQKIENILTDIKDYLNLTYEELTYREILELNLSKRPIFVNKDRFEIFKSNIKIKRDEINQTLINYKLKIKKEFLPYLNSIRSNFSVSVSGIEGIVISYKDIITKIIDKDSFTEINKFIWKIREEIRDRFINPLDVTLADMIGHPLLGYPSQRKRYLNKITKDNTTISAIKDISKNIDLIPLLKEVNSTYLKLNLFFQKYKSEYQSYELMIDKLYTYNTSVHNKTLLYFAESFTKLNTYSNLIEDGDKFGFLCLLSNCGDGNES